MALQTEGDIHSKWFMRHQDRFDRAWAKAERDGTLEGGNLEDDAPRGLPKTVDQGELYDGLALQTNDIHSKWFMRHQDRFDRAWAKAEREGTLEGVNLEE